MRVLVSLLVGVAALCGAEKPAAAKAAKPAAAARQPEKVVVPAGAVETEPGTWRYADKQGRKWIYRNTPWGVARAEEKKEDPAAAADRAASAQFVKAFDDGEYVRFERPGPFGVYKWRTAKKELNAEEQAAWERARGAAPPPAGKQE